MDVPSGWRAKDAALEREFRFRDFASALAFVNRLGEAAEAADHHPDVRLHDWNRVTVRWWTHTTGGITERDSAMARLTDGLA